MKKPNRYISISYAIILPRQSMGKVATTTPKILIVDDEAAILQALSLFLEQEGYSVEALAKFNNYLTKAKDADLPDLIILDILLNQEDGLKIARQLKKDSKTSHIPIVLISALPNVKKLSADVGADAYLPKPFSVTQLNEAIERLINSRD